VCITFPHGQFLAVGNSISDAGRRTRRKSLIDRCYRE
jgi:hypothetical protein